MLHNTCRYVKCIYLTFSGLFIDQTYMYMYMYNVHVYTIRPLSARVPGYYSVA